MGRISCHYLLPLDCASQRRLAALLGGALGCGATMPLSLLVLSGTVPHHDPRSGAPALSPRPLEHSEAPPLQPLLFPLAPCFFFRGASHLSTRSTRLHHLCFLPGSLASARPQPASSSPPSARASPGLGGITSSSPRPLA
eukprot:1371617-Rhodomonas_salina.1